MIDLSEYDAVKVRETSYEDECEDDRDCVPFEFVCETVYENDAERVGFSTERVKDFDLSFVADFVFDVESD